AVASVTIANGGDNLGIYTPVFATSPGPRLVLIVAVFAVMVALWLGIAHGLVHHPGLGAPIRRIGRVATPFVLIGIGAMVLVEAGTLS
ncbi:quaternary ammonium transporter, partial [Methylobacterium frigidaeris]